MFIRPGFGGFLRLRGGGLCLLLLRRLDSFRSLRFFGALAGHSQLRLQSRLFRFLLRLVSLALNQLYFHFVQVRHALLRPSHRLRDFAGQCLGGALKFLSRFKPFYFCHSDAPFSDYG
jgi:hypothetical protein